MRNRLVSSLELFIAVIMLSTVMASAQTITIQTYQGYDAVANEVLIKFEQAAPDDALGQAKISTDVQQAEISADIDQVQGVGSAGWLLFHSASRDVPTLMGMLTGASSVAYVEPNWVQHVAAVPNDPYFPFQWGLQNTGQSVGGIIGTPGADIGATSAWNISTGSASVLVGVVDTGIDYTHSDLAANTWSAPLSYSFEQGTTEYTCPAGSHGWNTLTNSCDPTDDNGHGTEVSGVIGAVGNNGVGVAGVNWTTTILAAKACDSQGKCANANVINALQYMEGVKCYFGGRSGEANIRVLNNSYGGSPYQQALYTEIGNVYEADMLFVAAAGDSGSNNTTPFYPASYSQGNIVSVAAFDNRDLLASTANNPPDSFSSNYGSTSVHLGAPGVIIETTTLAGFSYFSGTSAASPFVAGAGALSLSQCLGDTQWLVPNIVNNVVKTSALTGKTITGGRVNAYNSVYAASQACPGTGDGYLTGTEQSKTIHPGQIIYDQGSVSLTVNGKTETAFYGQGSTAYSVGSSLISAINNDSTSPVRAHLSFTGITQSYVWVMLSAKTTGSGTCYTMSASYTYDTTDFKGPSFQLFPTQSALVGCK